MSRGYDKICRTEEIVASTLRYKNLCTIEYVSNSGK